MNRRWLPKHVSAYKDRHGKQRYRYRRTGFPTYSFKHEPGTPEFLAELQACQAAAEIAPQSRIAPGTFDDLADKFYRSTAWANMKPITRSTYRNILNRFCKEHGGKPVAAVKPIHLDAIFAKMADKPGAAHGLRKTIKRLLSFAVKIEMVPVNAAAHTDPIKRRSTGYHSWSEEDIAQFRNFHALGTRARLAMELLLWTDQRRADVVAMGRQHERKGRLHVRQEKTGKLLWIKIAPQLREAVEAMPPADNLHFLVTEQGKPFTAAGFGGWFRDRCIEAGLPGRTPHGLRKAMARRAAELGGSDQQLKSLGGWSDSREVAIYTAAANQMTLADSIIDTVSDWEFGEPDAANLANLPKSG